MTNENADNTAKKQQKRVIGKPFEKGQSGNPAGRPKGSISVVSELKKKLEEIPKEGNPEKKRYLDMLVIKVIKKALADGDVPMIKDIIDRIDGKAKQPTELSGEVNLPTPILVKFINKKEDIKDDEATDDLI